MVVSRRLEAGGWRSNGGGVVTKLGTWSEGSKSSSWSEKVVAQA